MRRILLLHWNRLAREQTRYILERVYRNEVRINETDTWTKAKEILSSEPTDLLIIDSYYGSITVFELLAFVHVTYPQTKMILCAPDRPFYHPSPEDAYRFITRMVSGFLPPPISPGKLIKAVSGVFTERSVAVKSGPRGQGKPVLCILIVDDEPVLREAYREILEDHYRESVIIFEAKDGIEAQQFLSVQPVDLMMTDWQHPGPDGLELAQFAVQRSQQTKVILLSNWWPSNHPALSLFHRTLSKPVIPETLIEAVNDVGPGVTITPATGSNGL